VTPQTVLARERALLRECGLSDRKTEYIADLAQHFADGSIHVHRWPEMTDEQIIAELVQVRGIGRWTAEMFLIFNLLRPDVFPLDDLGLQKGIRVSYFSNRKVALSTMRRLGETWRPWRSVATWYLWRSLDPLPVEY
jgi:DNA-3-methyladenine glycosylase II